MASGIHTWPIEIIFYGCFVKIAPLLLIFPMRQQLLALILPRKCVLKLVSLPSRNLGMPFSTFAVGTSAVKTCTAFEAMHLFSIALVRCFYPKTGLRSFHVPWLIRTLSYTRAMNQTDHSRKETTVPPPIPDKLQGLLFAFRESKALFAACELGIFDLLHDSKSPQSAEDIAAKMKADADAATRLMDTLVALELLQKTKKGESWLYMNTQMASQFLSQSSPDSVYGYIKHSNKLLYPLFGNLESAVQEGSNQWMKTFGLSSEEVWKAVYGTEEARLRFLGAMHSTSRHSCHAVVKAFDLSQFHSCCDLGGE